MAENVNMARQHFILIDATLESQTPFFAQSPLFQSWLRSYNNVPEALEFITEIKLPRSIEVYVARDNILDDGLPSDRNGQIRTLLDTLCDLETIRHVSMFCPVVNTDLEQQTRSILANKRLLKHVISVPNFHRYMCREGIQYFEEEISRYKSRSEAHLIPNFQKNIEELMDYLEKLIQDQKPILAALVEEHSNKPGEESS